MKHTWKKRLIFLLFLLTLLSTFLITRPNAFPNFNKKHALLRLEDVGIGGPYATLDDLGKLRTVLNMLAAKQVPFTITVIPHTIYINQTGEKSEYDISKATTDQRGQLFIELLKTAEKSGAVIGMHGYTHQSGSQWLSEGNQNSGTGYEFNVNAFPETKSTEYATMRITKSINTFYQAGIIPSFWETPHYASSIAQKKVFQSHIGLLYEPDFRSLKSFWDLNMYETENDYGTKTLGSVYVPAPLQYIQPDQSGHTPKDIMKKLNYYPGLASMYFHPFLEFSYLEPERDASGKVVIKDGLPSFRYKKSEQSPLQQLIDGVRSKGFQWSFLHEMVPFSPAHRISLKQKVNQQMIMTGDVNGDGRDEIVYATKTGINVISGKYKWPRNQQQQTEHVWLPYPLQDDEQILLAYLDHDRRKDLIIYNKKSGETHLFRSTTQSFEKVTTVHFPSNLKIVGSGDIDGDQLDDLFFHSGQTVVATFNNNGHFSKPKTMLKVENETEITLGDFDGDQKAEILIFSTRQLNVSIYRYNGKEYAFKRKYSSNAFNSASKLLIGDTNGDHKDDLIMYEQTNGIWQIESAHDQSLFTPMDNPYGPWGKGSYVIVCADFDGNGKKDIGVIDNVHQVIDISLSFQPAKRIR